MKQNLSKSMKSNWWALSAAAAIAATSGCGQNETAPVVPAPAANNESGGTGQGKAPGAASKTAAEPAPMPTSAGPTPVATQPDATSKPAVLATPPSAPPAAMRFRKPM